MKEPSEDDIEKIVLSIVKFISNVNLGSGFLSFIIAGMNMAINILIFIGSIVYLGLNACIAVIPYLQMISILTVFC